MKYRTQWIIGLIAVCMLALGNDDLSIIELRRKAEGGDAGAQFGLGFRSAAEQGDVDAQYMLGHAYNGGFGVNQDIREALRWYRLAAGQGHIDAQVWLGKTYFSGPDGVKDFGEGVKWFHLAAENGSSDALFELGRAYRIGLGAPKDFNMAFSFYRLAAEKGNPMAQVSVGLIYEQGIEVSKDVNKAIKWYRQAAGQGYGKAQHLLGSMYYGHKGIVEDKIEAYAWLSLAAKNGFESSQEVIIHMEKSFRLDNASIIITLGKDRAQELQGLIDRGEFLAETTNIQLPNSGNEPSGFGSGFLVKGGYVLTCWHVVEGATRISVSINGKDAVATVVQKDPANDIAFLKVVDVDGGAALNFSNGVKLGEKVFTLGYPHPDLQGSDVKFTTGSISAMTGPENTPRYFQISAPLQSGNSGGPLFDEKGNLVGIVAAKLNSIVTLALTGDLPQNVNYAIKGDYLLPLLKTVAGLEVGKEKTKDVNLLELIEELKKSVVMVRVY